LTVYLNMELFKHTLFINLASRKDRLEHVTSELNKMGINGQRVDAVKMASGAIGCSLSHIKCLEIAKESKYEQVFICEDDITFLNPELLKQNITKFYENKTINWDVLIIGGNNGPPFQKINEYCSRVFNCQTTTGYIVKCGMYDVLIDNFKTGLSKLLKTPQNKREYAIDMYWKRLQIQYYWYIITPLTIIQYENYSDVEDQNVNYSHLMLDLNKEWLTKQKQLQYS
jgi:GR25 family glycosyltransferase involved in LPS biosynthesis